MTVVVRTRSGLVTEIREAWHDWGGRPVWTWRTDKDKPPHDFRTLRAAQDWIYAVFHASTRKEREQAAWTIETSSTVWKLPA